MNLLGIIDRVDRRNGVIRIVDYKTGRDELKYTNLEDIFKSDTEGQNKALVQTLFYTYIYEQVKGTRAVEPNLYIIRKIRNEGTLFYFSENRSKMILEAGQLQNVKQEFKDMLQKKLEEIFNPETPFRQTEIEDNCLYCPYKSMCGRLS